MTTGIGVFNAIGPSIKKKAETQFAVVFVDSLSSRGIKLAENTQQRIMDGDLKAVLDESLTQIREVGDTFTMKVGESKEIGPDSFLLSYYDQYEGGQALFKLNGDTLRFSLGRSHDLPKPMNHCVLEAVKVPETKNTEIEMRVRCSGD